jgi:hypothetical protein
MRLALRPDGRQGQFAAYLGDELVCTSRQPFLDGARELVRRGYDPTLLLTTRHEGKGYDNFIPRPIGELAGLTVSERDSGLRLERYRAFDGPAKQAGVAAAVASPMRKSLAEAA